MGDFKFNVFLNARVFPHVSYLHKSTPNIILEHVCPAKSLMVVSGGQEAGTDFVTQPTLDTGPSPAHRLQVSERPEKGGGVVCQEEEASGMSCRVP